MGQPKMSFRLPPPVYEELKMTVLDLSLYNNRNAVLKAIQGPPILLTNLQTSPSHEVAQSQKACRDCKRSGLRPSWGDLHPGEDLQLRWKNKANKQAKKKHNLYSRLRAACFGSDFFPSRYLGSFWLRGDSLKSIFL